MQVEQLPQTQQFRWSVRIYYEDTDAGGVVYHTHYLKYFERARTELLRRWGFSQQAMGDQQHAMFMLKSALVDYHLPAKLDDELIITTEVEKFGRASLVFLQKAWRGDRCLADGRIKVGCVNTQTLRPCAIPEAIRHVMQQKLNSC